MNKLTADQLSRKSFFRRSGVLAGYETSQKMASESLQFGLRINYEGYNIFVLGEPGLNKHELVKELVTEKAAHENVPADYVYVHNFKAPYEPLFIEMPPGRGGELARDMADFLESCRKEIAKIFESKEYEAEKNQIVEKFQEFDRQIFEALTEEARGRGFALQRNPDGFVFLPLKENEVLNEEQFSKLSDHEKRAIQERVKFLQARLKDEIKIVKEAEKETKRKLVELEKRMVRAAIAYHIDEIKEKFGFSPKLVEYLSLVEEDVLDNLEDFKQPDQAAAANSMSRLFRQEPSYIRYRVNVLIDRSGETGAPVVYETNPNHFNLIGKVEYRFQMGMAVTDFTLIKPGALHRANGGYLIIDAIDLFRNPFSYEALVRALKNREIRIEDPLEPYRMSSGTLKPEAIPLNVKLVLIGSPMIYYILHYYDENFSKLFKVKVDFDNDILWDENAERLYSFFIDRVVEKDKLLPFDDTAVARVIEQGGRLVDDQKKLSMKVESLATIAKEASFVAQEAGRTAVSGTDVETAMSRRKERHNRIERRVQEQIMRDVLLVATDGVQIGTVNGLSVYDMGDYRFGRPSRLTAKAFAGKEGIIHLDREAKLSGKIHDKGALVISSYLNGKFARDASIGFSATISFEQLYGMVEGDSASMAEAVVVQSALGNFPIRQDIAITGSMNQHGETQPIGGVNEKIEGFFAVCRDRGLTGTQGVIIPESNMQHLMLEAEVIQAVEQGRFHIYAVKHADEALAILSGLSAGERTADGGYPPETANYRVDEAIREFKKKQKEQNGKKKKDDE